MKFIKTIDGSDMLYVGLTSVRADYQKKGIGTMIMKHVEKHATGRKICLDVFYAAEDQRLQKLYDWYKSLGYEKVSGEMALDSELIKKQVGTFDKKEWSGLDVKEKIRKVYKYNYEIILM